MSYASETKKILRQKDLLNDNIKNTDDVIDILETCILVRIGALVTVIADAAMTATVTQRVTTGSETDAVAVDTIVIPNTTAVGKIVYTDVENQKLYPGDQLKFAMSNTGSSTAVSFFAVVIPQSEMAENESDMVESA